MKTDFYVYALFDKNGIVRYIGKGRRNRWMHHERKPCGYNRFKDKFIADALAELGEVPKVKIRQNLTEQEAYRIEEALIAAIGRADLKTGPLSNLSDGGTGGDYGERIREVKAQWTDEMRQHVSAVNSIAQKAHWANLPPDKAAEIRKENADRLTRTRRLALERDPDYEIKRGLAVSEGLLRRTTEAVAESSAKALITYPPEERSKATKAWHDSRTPEERSETLKKGWRDLTPEEYAIRCAAHAGPEASERVRQQQANLTPEQIERRKQRALDLAVGTIWITDGTYNKRLKEGLDIPDGWRRGKVPSPKKPKPSQSKPT